jgi:tetratricopeptide (TPR) repeat protein
MDPNSFPRNALVIACLALLSPTWTAAAGAPERDRTFSDCQLGSSELVEAETLSLAGKYAEAQARFESVLRGEEGRMPPDPSNLACLMNMIGLALVRQHQAQPATGWFRRAREFTPLPLPLAAFVAHNLANAYIDLGKLDEAEEIGRQATQLAEKAFGPDHVDTGTAFLTLAAIHYARGNLDRAEPIFRRVLYNRDKMVGIEPHEVAIAAANLGQVYLAQKRSHQARQLFERAVAELSKSKRTGLDEIALCQTGLMLTYALEKRERETGVLMVRLLTFGEEVLGPEHASFAMILQRAGTARFLLKDYQASVRLFERALPIIESSYGPSSPQAIDCLRSYAQSAHMAKDKIRVRQLEDRLRIVSGLADLEETRKGRYLH